MNAEKQYHALRGKYSVIYLTFKDAKREKRVRSSLR